MIVLGDCNSMFDTLVRITAALKARLPGIGEDPADVDCSIPTSITLICETDTTADKQSLIYTSEEPTCERGDLPHSHTCYSSEPLVNTRDKGHRGGLHEPSLYPASVDVDLSSAPNEATGNIGLNSKDLPDRPSIHYLGLNQAEWQTLIMMYPRDTVSTYAGVKICDICHTMMSTATASHDCSTKDIATIKSWVNRLFF